MQDKAVGCTLGRYHGGLEATGKGEMLTVEVKGYGGSVERLRWMLNGREG